MVSRHAVLILLALSILLLPSASSAVSRCLRCHPSHHGDKGSCTWCHGGNEATDRKRVAHDKIIPGRYAWGKIPRSPMVESGMKLIDSLACRRCHVVGKKGNRFAGSLDNAPLVRQPEELAGSIRMPVEQMPDFRLDDHAVVSLVNAILANAAPPERDEPPTVVHFSRVPEKEDLFQKKCGGCHRMFSGRKGGLGSGQTAPNLSGLLTTFYPKTFRNGMGWTVERLKKWVGNPRTVRKQAVMPPVSLKKDEWEGIRRLFDDDVR